MVLATVASDSLCALLCALSTSETSTTAESCHDTSQSSVPTVQGTPDDACPGNHLGTADPIVAARPFVVLGTVPAIAPVPYAVAELRLARFLTSGAARSASPPGFALALRI